jgi:Arc/MetJ-type ribon-helix-helix transcriptional regulator
MSVNFTVRIPKKLAERMRKHSDVNWSEVVRRSIEEHLRMLEEIK